MNQVLVSLIKRNGPVNSRDWMGFVQSKKNDFTFHHIAKEEHGGKMETDNGAVLTKDAHRLLHVIENCNNNLYKTFNSLFKKFNMEHRGPSIEELIYINELLLEFSKQCLSKSINKQKRSFYVKLMNRICSDLRDLYYQLYIKLYDDKKEALMFVDQNKYLKTISSISSKQKIKKKGRN